MPPCPPTTPQKRRPPDPQPTPPRHPATAQKQQAPAPDCPALPRHPAAPRRDPVTGPDRSDGLPGSRHRDRPPGRPGRRPRRPERPAACRDRPAAPPCLRATSPFHGRACPNRPSISPGRLPACSGVFLSAAAALIHRAARPATAGGRSPVAGEVSRGVPTHRARLSGRPRYGPCLPGWAPGSRSRSSVARCGPIGGGPGRLRAVRDPTTPCRASRTTRHLRSPAARPGCAYRHGSYLAEDRSRTIHSVTGSAGPTRRPQRGQGPTLTQRHLAPRFPVAGHQPQTGSPVSSGIFRLCA